MRMRPAERRALTVPTEPMLGLAGLSAIHAGQMVLAVRAVWLQQLEDAGRVHRCGCDQP